MDILIRMLETFISCNRFVTLDQAGQKCWLIPLSWAENALAKRLWRVLRSRLDAHSSCSVAYALSFVVCPPSP